MSIELVIGVAVVAALAYFVFFKKKGDLNQDGYPDLVYSCNVRAVHVMLNDKSGGFNAPVQIDAEHIAHQAAEQVAQRLAGLLRHDDTVARLGDDRFGLILHHINGFEARKLLRKIWRALVLDPATVDLMGPADFVPAFTGGIRHPERSRNSRMTPKMPIHWVTTPSRPCMSTRRERSGIYVMARS